MRRNEEIARLFQEYADLLEATGDDFRPRSYRRAAENIRDYPESLEEVAAGNGTALQEIEGVGESIAAKIVEYLETGEVAAIEAARDELPVDMEALTRVEGIGPRRVGDLYRELGVTTLGGLEAAAEAGKIRELDGWGQTMEANILENLPFAKQIGDRQLLGEARPVANALVSYLQAGQAVDRCAVGGSLRRWCETIGDIDVLAAGEDHAAIVDRFVAWERTGEVIEAGTTKASLRARGQRVDLRVVDPGEWGSALQYFTGSKAHNIRLRNHAISRGYKVNEYGVFDVSDVDDPDADQRVGQWVAGETEAGVYAALGLSWIPPELREDTGEIDAAMNALPELIELGDLRGDLHVHTTWSDGQRTVEDMAAAAAEFGHEYIAITDHASGAGVVGGMGLDDEDLRDQLHEIRAVGETAEIEVLAGVEANIERNGGISVGESILSDLDVVIASPHSRLSGDGTDRLVAAIEHPATNIIGHPSGRRLNERPGLELDIDAVVTAAATHDVALEVNANPARLDLWDRAIRRAVTAGAPIVINTDAHAPADYGHLEYGVMTARRGWAGPSNVLNTRRSSTFRDRQ